jgi:hypothetical protein
MGCQFSLCFGEGKGPAGHKEVDRTTNKQSIWRRQRNRTTIQSGPTCNEEEIDLSHFAVSDKIIGIGGKHSLELIVLAYI